MAARTKSKNESAARRKSLDMLASDEDSDRRRDMVARRLSYQHKSGRARGYGYGILSVQEV